MLRSINRPLRWIVGFTVCALTQIVFADSGADQLQSAIKVEKELRSKTSMFERKPDYSPAVELYTKALSTNDLSIAGKLTALSRRAGLNIAMGNCVSAVEDLSEVLKVSPDNAKARASRGFCSRELGKLDIALEDLNRAIALIPKDASLFKERAAVYTAKGDFERAVKDLSTSAKLLSPADSADLYVLRGDALSSQGKHDAAIADYQRAVRIIKRNAANLLPKDVQGEGHQLAPVYIRLRDAYNALATSRGR